MLSQPPCTVSQQEMLWKSKLECHFCIPKQELSKDPSGNLFCTTCNLRYQINSEHKLEPLDEFIIQPEQHRYAVPVAAASSQTTTDNILCQSCQHNQLLIIQAMSNFDLPDHYPPELVKQKSSEYLEFLEQKYPLCSICVVRGNEKISQLNRKMKLKQMRNNISTTLENNNHSLVDISFSLLIYLIYFFSNVTKILFLVDLYFTFKSELKWKLFLIPISIAISFTKFPWLKFIPHLGLILVRFVSLVPKKIAVQPSNECKPLSNHPTPKIEQIFEQFSLEDSDKTNSLFNPTLDQNKKLTSNESQLSVEIKKNFNLKTPPLASPFSALKPSQFSFDCGLESAIDSFSFSKTKREFSPSQPTTLTQIFGKRKEEIKNNPLPSTKSPIPSECKYPTRPLVSLNYPLLFAFIILSYKLFLQSLFILFLICSSSGKFTLNAKFNLSVIIVSVFLFGLYTSLGLEDLLFFIGGNDKMRLFFFLFCFCLNLLLFLILFKN